MKNDSNNTIEQPHQAAPLRRPRAHLCACGANDSFLTLHYRLAGAHGDVINTFGALPATLSMGSGAGSGVRAVLAGAGRG